MYAPVPILFSASAGRIAADGLHVCMFCICMGMCVSTAICMYVYCHNLVLFNRTIDIYWPSQSY